MNNQGNRNVKTKRPLIITIFCILGTIWLFMMLLGIYGFILNIQKNYNFLNTLRLIIEILLFVFGIIALRFYWLMKKRGVWILGLIAGIEIVFNLYYGFWPLSLACGCQFPIILTILGLIYFKQMS